MVKLRVKEIINQSTVCVLPLNKGKSSGTNFQFSIQAPKTKMAMAVMPNPRLRNARPKKQRVTSGFTLGGNSSRTPTQVESEPSYVINPLAVSHVPSKLNISFTHKGGETASCKDFVKYSLSVFQTRCSLKHQTV